MIFVYVPFPDREKAEEMAKFFVQEKLVVCVNILGQGESFYLWEGELQQDKEIYVIFKVLPMFVENVVNQIKQRHPYDNPAILSWEVKIQTQEYADWSRLI